MYAKGEPFFLVWRADPGKSVCPEGESMAEVQKRMTEVLEAIAEDHLGEIRRMNNQ